MGRACACAWTWTPGPKYYMAWDRGGFHSAVTSSRCADCACALSLSRAALQAQINVIHASRASLGCRAHVRVLSPPPPPSTFSRLQRNIGKCQYHGGGRPPGTPPTQAQVVPLQVPGTLYCPGHWHWHWHWPFEFSPAANSKTRTAQNRGEVGACICSVHLTTRGRRRRLGLTYAYVCVYVHPTSSRCVHPCCSLSIEQDDDG